MDVRNQAEACSFYSMLTFVFPLLLLPFLLHVEKPADAMQYNNAKGPAVHLDFISGRYETT